MSRVERDNDDNVRQILWHIQNMNITSAGSPFDTFIWSDHEPTDDELETIIREEIDADEDTVDEFITSSDIHTVYAEDISDYGGVVGGE